MTDNAHQAMWKKKLRDALSWPRASVPKVGCTLIEDARSCVEGVGRVLAGLGGTTQPITYPSHSRFRRFAAFFASEHATSRTASMLEPAMAVGALLTPMAQHQGKRHRLAGKQAACDK
jgi:hypothetical protein